MRLGRNFKVGEGEGRRCKKEEGEQPSKTNISLANSLYCTGWSKVGEGRRM